MASSTDLNMGESGRLTEVRIVLLGYDGTQVSSAGNTILGREETDATRPKAGCKKRQGSVAGRQVTVVNTSEWWISDSVKDHLCVQERVKDWVSLCPPGPHAFLKVIPVETLKGREWTVEATLEILPERVWRHTVVLFTSKEKLSERAIEQLIERERCLQQIVKKCGNRYHVLNTTDRADGTQVTELLQKIEEMVAGNSGAYFLLDEALQELREKRRAVEERGKQRLMKVQKQRETLRALRMAEQQRETEELKREMEDLGNRDKMKEKEISLLKEELSKRKKENEETEREKNKMGEAFRGKMKEMTQKCEETEQKLRREVKELKDREEEQQRKTEEMQKRNKGKEEEISQLKEELCKLQKEKEESTAPVRNIVEMDLYMSGATSPESTELMSQEEMDRQRDRDRQMQREEQELRAQHQAEQEEWERRMREEMRRREESLIKPLEKKIRDLEERLRGERDEQRRRELEGELRREREQIERLEREEERRREEEQRERREREERQRGEMEALRQRYRQEAREDAGRSLNVGAVALGAAIGAIAGAQRGPLGAAAGTAIGAVAGGQLGALIRGGQRDGGKRREERRSSTKDSMLSVRRRNSLEFVRPTF